MGNGDVHTFAKRTAMYATDGDASCVVAVVEAGDEHLWCAFEYLRLRNVLQDAVEQIRYVLRGCLPVFGHPALLGGAVDDGEVELLFRSVEVAHQVEHHFIHFFRTAVGLIDLIDDDDRFQAYLKCFLQDEARLWHRSLEGIDQEQASVGHVEHALHFAAEVRVARSVDDVYLCIFVVDADVL